MSKNHKHNKLNSGDSVMPRNRIFYWAYGSNLSVRQMRQRCPRATKYGPMTVKDAALVFRYYADVTTREGSSVPGGLWQITAECERALDVYEGVEAKNYLKRYFLIQIKGKSYTCLFYQMRASRGIMPPNEQYIDTIAEGYADFGLDLADLDAALNEAWGTKDITQRLAEKHERRGRPRLARSILPLPDDPKEGRQGAKIDSKSGQLLLPPPMWTGRE